MSQPVDLEEIRLDSEAEVGQDMQLKLSGSSVPRNCAPAVHTPADRDWCLINHLNQLISCRIHIPCSRCMHARGCINWSCCHYHTCTRSQQMWKLDLKWKEKEVLGKRRENRQRRSGKIHPCTLLLRLHSMVSWGGRDRGALE